MELDSQKSLGEIKRRVVELDSQESPGEINSREVGLFSPGWMDCLASELFLNCCFSDTDFVPYSC